MSDLCKKQQIKAQLIYPQSLLSDQTLRLEFDAKGIPNNLRPPHWKLKQIACSIWHKAKLGCLHSASPMECVDEYNWGDEAWVDKNYVVNIDMLTFLVRRYVLASKVATEIGMYDSQLASANTQTMYDILRSQPHIDTHMEQTGIRCRWTSWSLLYAETIGIADSIYNIRVNGDMHNEIEHYVAGCIDPAYKQFYQKMSSYMQDMPEEDRYWE